jgi:hypothetical protein
MQNFVLQEPRVTTPGVARGATRVWDIPVPPYDKPLPESYWNSLKGRVGLSQTPKPAKTLSAIPWLEIWHWTKTVLAIGAFLFVIGWLCSLKSPIGPAPHTDAEVAAMHPVVPETPAMVAGNQYWVTLPDGRKILVNFKGSVDHACNLPKQPAGGANNAMYVDRATGTDWIWTVPAGASNVPTWIDP